MIFREQPESDACWRRASPAAPLFPQKAGAVPSEGSSEHCVDAGCEPALVLPFRAHLRKKKNGFCSDSRTPARPGHLTEPSQHVWRLPRDRVWGVGRSGGCHGATASTQFGKLGLVPHPHGQHHPQPNVDVVFKTV